MKSSRFVVMGVSGCGKSTVGRLLARRLNIEFLEGDELHSPQNVARMAAGVALTDEDRQGWLQALADRIAAARADNRALVVSCSALKRSYRDRLRQGDAQLRLVHLTAAPALLAARLGARQDHYMPPSLLASQLAALEAPAADEDALVLDAAQAPEAIVDSIVTRLGRG